jgi:hypothetical protein
MVAAPVGVCQDVSVGCVPRGGESRDSTENYRLRCGFTSPRTPYGNRRSPCGHRAFAGVSDCDFVK